jgi:hypothetical protein
MSDQSDNMEAIYVFMKGSVPKTTAATTIRSQFLDWYGKLGFWNKTMDSNTYDEARTRRNQFNLKNATTPTQLAAVQDVITKGITSEQMQGKARPAVDKKTGAVGSQVKNPTTPTGVSLTRNLKSGVSGNDVKAWQSFLGLTPPTGYFDKPTDSKTRDYQKSNGLNADGIVGPKTWSKAFGAQPAPFKATESVSANIASAFKTSSAPTSTPSPTAAKETTFKETVASIPSHVEASVIPSVDTIKKLPLWAKITGGLAAIGGIIFGVHYHEKHAKM